MKKKFRDVTVQEAWQTCVVRESCRGCSFDKDKMCLFVRLPYHFNGFMDVEIELVGNSEHLEDEDGCTFV